MFDPSDDRGCLGRVEPQYDFWIGVGCGVIAGFTIVIVGKMWGLL